MKPTDPRIAALYDDDNPDGPDHDHYRRRCNELGARSIIDLGCGTGILTVTLAGPDRTVVGIDPDQGMLDVAIGRSRSERAHWVLGDSRDIEASSTDLVLMTGNVAQHIDPDDWPRTLADIAGGLRSGGTLTFETRNPLVEAWRTWTPERTRSTRITEGGPLTDWIDATEPDDEGTVVLTATNVWATSGETVVIHQPLTFRSLETVNSDLARAGLAASNVWGGWHREPFNDSSPLIVIEATNRARPIAAPQ